MFSKSAKRSPASLVILAGILGLGGCFTPYSGPVVNIAQTTPVSHTKPYAYGKTT